MVPYLLPPRRIAPAAQNLREMQTGLHQQAHPNWFLQGPSSARGGSHAFLVQTEDTEQQGGSSTMNKSLHIIAAAAVLVLVGCTDSLDPLGPVMPEGNPPVSLGTPADEGTVVPLIARRGREVGTVTVSNDETNLYVTFTPDDPWRLYRTGLAVSTHLGRFALPGHPQPDNMAFITRHNGVAQYTYEIPLGDSWLETNQELFLAADAFLRRPGGGLFGPRALTAWADGAPYFDRRWRAYFTYTVQSSGSSGDCTLTLEMPNGGDILCLSQFAEIIWESSGQDCGDAVRLELLHDGAACVTIAEEAPNTGFYFWDEVQRCGDEWEGYTILVTDLESGSSDESDGPFVIDLCPE